MLNRYRAKTLSIDITQCYAEIIDKFVYINIPHSGASSLYPGDPSFIDHYPAGYDDRSISPNVVEEIVDEAISIKIDTTGMNEDNLRTIVNKHLDDLVIIKDLMNNEIESFNENLPAFIEGLVDDKLSSSVLTEKLIKKAKPDMKIKIRNKKGNKREVHEA